MPEKLSTIIINIVLFYVCMYVCIYVCIYVSLSHSFAVSLRGQYLLYSVFVVHFDRFDVLCIALPFCMVYAAQRGFCCCLREREGERERYARERERMSE